MRIIRPPGLLEGECQRNLALDRFRLGGAEMAITVSAMEAKRRSRVPRAAKRSREARPGGERLAGGLDLVKRDARQTRRGNRKGQCIAQIAGRQACRAHPSPCRDRQP